MHAMKDSGEVYVGEFGGGTEGKNIAIKLQSQT